MFVFKNKKIFPLFAGFVLTVLMFAGCRSAPAEPKQQEIVSHNVIEDPLCVREYSQEEIAGELSQLRRSDNRRDYSGDAAFANFREINTNGIRPGQLFRSSHPAMSGARPPYAARQAEQARVFTVINMSDTKAEMAQYASLIPWYQNFINRDAINVMQTGTDYFDSDFTQKLNAAIQFMLLRRGPYLIHCDDGVDRTGFVSVLFEALMGAAPEEIIRDYMQSYVNYYGFAENEERYRIVAEIPKHYLCAMNNGRVVTASNVSLVAEKYLIEKAGLGSNSINELRERLGEPR